MSRVIVLAELAHVVVVVVDVKPIVTSIVNREWYILVPLPFLMSLLSI